MYNRIERLAEAAFGTVIPQDVKAFAFNLYEDADDIWSVEIVGTGSFDKDDEDWACDEITDFGTRNEPVSWQEETDWETVLQKVVSAVKEYLEKGKYSEKLKEYAGIGVGFVDGDIELVYVKE